MPEGTPIQVTLIDNDEEVASSVILAPIGPGPALPLDSPYSFALGDPPDGFDCHWVEGASSTADGDGLLSGTTDSSGSLSIAIHCLDAPSCPDNDNDGVTACGPDGIPGTADDDCDDNNSEVSPETEEQCDGFDSDCDGFDVAQVDTDGDGLMDGCDGNPTESCEPFQLSDLEDALASGGTCVDHDDEEIDGASVWGVHRSLADGVFTFVGLAFDSDGAWFAVNGCLDAGAAGSCDELTPPLPPTEPVPILETATDACFDLIADQCPVSEVPG